MGRKKEPRCAHRPQPPEQGALTVGVAVTWGGGKKAGSSRGGPKKAPRWVSWPFPESAPYSDGKRRRKVEEGGTRVGKAGAKTGCRCMGVETLS